MLKRKGYLMIDVCIALALFSIFSLSIISIYNSYINFKAENNIRLESIEIFNSIVMESINNTTFNEFNDLEVGNKYYISTKDIKEIISNSLVSLLNGSRSEEEYCAITVLPRECDSVMDVEIEYYKEQGKFIYENKEVIRKYSFIRWKNEDIY